jgi:6-phosphogluconolactonase (cycloisomerase 2 family)
MTKLWLTMTKLCFASIPLLVIGVVGTAEADVGAVYTMTNDPAGNAVVAYDRAADGTLTMSGTFPTGGTSIGFFATGNQNGLLLSSNGHCLWAVNSMSNSISAFEVKGTSLSLANVVDSGGHRPISLTVDQDLLYVLNAGGQVGFSDNVTGFTVGKDCRLSPLAGSTRALSAPDVSPAQVGFDPTGSVLLVTEKTNDGGVKGGNITTFMVGRNGLLSSGKSLAMPCGPANTSCPVTEPFGFAFDNRGQLLVTAADCHGPALPGNLPGCSVPPDHPTLFSYTLARNGTLTLVDALVDDQAAACWIVITNSQQFAFTVNALGTQTGGTPGFPPAGSITGFHVSPDGSLKRLGVTPVPLAPVGVPVDAALSLNSRFLYVLSEGDGSISAYKVGNDGGLTLLNTYAVTAVPPITTTGVPFPNGLAAQ